MKIRIAIALALLSASASQSFANSARIPDVSTLARILQGHGEPGESATSVSNPAISYVVREDGKLVKTNTKFGTTEVVLPNWWFGMSPREREIRGLY